MKTTETMNAVQPYEAPQVEVIEVAVEKGFAQSGSDIEALNEEEW